ncbi:MAG: dTDP-4-dehydrorhamnose reductase [Deltaproteobacteria bacterium]|nr:dTDP-4-dehydrorhamnose reductase [Deltaproteobacteria bacterium]
MRFFVTGSGGQLGRCLVRQVGRTAGRTLAAAPSHAQLDVGDRDAVRAALDAARPDVVVNAAAFTWVDRCESERELAWRINAAAPGLLARECAGRGIRLVHVSTDYVFDGEASRPYTEEDRVAPRSEYGRGKLEGERQVWDALPDALVVRTSWVFGPGRNFIATMLGLAGRRRAEGDETALRVVDDQFGSPTYADDLAGWILRLVEGRGRGLYHLANRGVATWWEVAREALDLAGFREVPIERVATSEFPRPAPRPAYSALDCTKAEAAGVARRGWREALAAYVASADSPRAGFEENR